MPKSRMRRSIPPFHNTPSWRGAQLNEAQGQLYLYFYFKFSERKREDKRLNRVV